ncbi:membrane protein insertion efficiency factor YidD [Williamsia sp. SKLECPSW1]
MSRVAAFPRQVLVWSIELYRVWISPTRMPSCRFEPTCSAYAVEAITTWGAVRGGGLAVWRLLRCGPWHAPGYDPVPERRPSTRASEERVTPC